MRHERNLARCFMFLASCGNTAQGDMPIGASDNSRIGEISKKLDSSGTRIERWSHTRISKLTDGTEIDSAPSYTMVDSKYGWECTMQRAADGVTRCLPGNDSLRGMGGPGKFLDSACMQGVAISPFVDLAAEYGRADNSDIYIAGPEVKPAPTEYYVIEAGACSRHDVATFPWPVLARKLGAKIPASDFVGYATGSVIDTKL